MTKKTIQSINAEYNYEDTHPGGKRDSSLNVEIIMSYNIFLRKY